MNQINQNNQPALARLMAGEWKKGAIPPKWDGKAAERIVKNLERVLTSTYRDLRQERIKAAIVRAGMPCP